MYSGPNISSIDLGAYPDGVPTTGGVVRVAGSDFGLPGSMSASLVRLVAPARRRALAEVLPHGGGGGDDWAVATPAGGGLGRLLLGADDDAYDPGLYDDLPYLSVAVVNQTHSGAALVLGPGEGSNALLVNVSGQVSRKGVAGPGQPWQTTASPSPLCQSNSKRARLGGRGRGGAGGAAGGGAGGGGGGGGGGGRCQLGLPLFLVRVRVRVRVTELVSL